MITNTSQALDGMVLFAPAIEIWSGTVRVRRDEDLVDAKASLPPSELISDGRKRLIPKDSPLKRMLSCRKAVERLLKTHGFPFMGGIAVPEAKVSEIEDELPKKQEEFIGHLDQLCSSLSGLYAQLESEHPDWAPMLRSSRLSENEVRARCRFDVLTYRVVAPDASVSQAAASRFVRVANAALPKLLEDIASRAEEILKASFHGRLEVTQRAVNPVRDLIEKLETFSFIDPRVGPMAAAMATQLDALPKQGPLPSGQTASVVMVLNTLADPDALLQHASTPIQAVVDDDLFQGSPTDSTEPEEESQDEASQAHEDASPAARPQDASKAPNRTSFSIGF